jgi:putative copper resistance protein D
MPDLPTVQRAATVILNASVATLAGATLSTRWLTDGAIARGRLLARLALGAVMAALLADVALLWFQAASMADVPLSAARDAVRLVLTGSHYGTAWLLGLAALALTMPAVALLRARPRATGTTLAVFALLGAFWYSQCMSSHASADGDFSALMLACAIHLGAISVWVGEVLVAATVVLGRARTMRPDVRATYVQALSTSASAALAVIFGSGLYLAWRNLGGVASLFATRYGNVLLAKLVLVGLAASMGGYNRFAIMPALTAGAQDAPARFAKVLRVEAVVLLAVLVAAAVLSSTAPPGADA